jgi:fumarylacetoacetate (FAA) hydrolase
VKLARYRRGDGTDQCGLVDGDHVVPVGTGDDLLELAMRRRLLPATGPPVSVGDVELLAPVPEPPSIRDFYAFEAHVATARRGRGLEMDPDWYQMPVFYFSNPAAVFGPDEPIPVPPGCQAFDFELEVAAVIGHDVDGADASAECIAGFTIMNDWSARDLQAREMRQGLGPAKGKDSATSLGPWLVTPDELGGWELAKPRATMTARIDGQVVSKGELGDIHHSWDDLVRHAASGTRLRAGDVIGSGTVGTGCLLELRISAEAEGEEPPPWLDDGAVVELEVEGLGVLRNRIGVPAGGDRASTA